MRVVGRPSKLTQDTKEKLISSLETGCFLEPACQYAGIGYSTFRRWMLKGEQASSGEFYDFPEVTTREQTKAKALIHMNSFASFWSFWRLHLLDRLMNLSIF